MRAPEGRRMIPSRSARWAGSPLLVAAALGMLGPLAVLDLPERTIPAPTHRARSYVALRAPR